MPTKIKKIEGYIKKKLLVNLPVNYRYLDYFDLHSNRTIKIRTIEVSQYYTTQYISSGHYKPVSKCLEIIK
jgi:hypothetical protein